MGIEDEHWCSVCKRALDKKKDPYVEFELVNDPTVLVKGKPKKPKGIICQKCIDLDPKLKEAMELMVKAGNPNVILAVRCMSAMECETYEPSKQREVNCKHVAMIDDRIYCKRSHPGVLKLPREKTEIDRMNRRIMFEQIRKFVKDPRLRQIMDPTVLEEQLKKIYLPPSAVIEEQHLDLPQHKEGEKVKEVR